MGIFRSVELRVYAQDRIDDVLVLQHHSEGKVELEVKVSTAQSAAERKAAAAGVRESISRCDIPAACEIFAEIDGQRVKLENGEGTVTIRDPKLWWARGYGEQYLYDLRIVLEKDGKLLDVWQKKIGLRTLTVTAENDRLGREFTFVLNGVKIFAMGANYIPQDSILARIPPERTEKFIKR